MIFPTRTLILYHLCLLAHASFKPKYFGCSPFFTGVERQLGTYLRSSTASVETCFEKCQTGDFTFAGLQCGDDSVETFKCYCYIPQTGLNTGLQMTTPNTCGVWGGDDSEYEIGLSSATDNATVAFYGILPAVDYGVDPTVAPYGSVILQRKQPTDLTRWSKTVSKEVCRNTSNAMALMSQGSDFSLLPDATFVINSDTIINGTLTIPEGTTLIFAPTDGVTLSAKHIVVSGTLQLGTEGCPLEAEGVGITLTGAKPAYSAEAGSTKGIVVTDGGVLDLHGRPITPTWTRLKETAAVGAIKLQLEDAVAGHWQVGDEVVIITTRSADFDDVDHENEVREIVAVSGSTVVLASALTHEHWAGDEYSAEVGLLSRSITIEGDAQSEADSFGGHVTCLNGAVCRISFVKAYRMGATNVLGSYPFHFHLMGSLNYTSYLRGSAVYHSFFRVVSIHGTNEVMISSNVAYDITGSGIYLEDGVEMNNTFEYNLVAHVLPIDPPARPYEYYDMVEDSRDATVEWIFPTTKRLVPVDLTPAAFYCTNQHNRWVGNAASGGFAGFYFPAVPYVLGVSRADAEYLVTNTYETDFKPVDQVGLEFDSNTIHSSGQHWDKGGCFYSGGVLMTPTSNNSFYAYNFGKFPMQHNTGSLTPSFKYPDINRGAMSITNSKIWGCGNCLLAWGTKLTVRPLTIVDGAEFSDCKMGLQFFAHNIGANLMFTAHTNNTNSWGGVYLPMTGFKTYDNFMQTIFTNITLRGFKGPTDMAFMALVTDDNSAQEGFAAYHSINSKDTGSQNDKGVFQMTRGRYCEHVGDGSQASFANTEGHTRMSAWDWATSSFNPSTGSATSLLNAIDLDGSLSGVGAPYGAVLGAADCPSQDYAEYRSRDWWKVDESECELKFTGLSVASGSDTVESGLWACPRKPNLIARPWATVPRSVVEIRFRRETLSLPAPEDIIPSSTVSQAEFISGLIYHWGDATKYSELVWRWKETFDYGHLGLCCDVGWYFLPDRGAEPGTLKMYIPQMVFEGGLFFATPYPTDAGLTITRCKRDWPTDECESVTAADSKLEFLKATNGLKYYRNSTSGNVFMRLLNPDNTYFEYGSVYELKNMPDVKVYYAITSDKTTRELINMSLPAADWAYDASLTYNYSQYAGDGKYKIIRSTTARSTLTPVPQPSLEPTAQPTPLEVCYDPVADTDADDIWFTCQGNVLGMSLSYTTKDMCYVHCVETYGEDFEYFNFDSVSPQWCRCLSNCKVIKRPSMDNTRFIGQRVTCDTDDDDGNTEDSEDSESLATASTSAISAAVVGSLVVLVVGYLTYLKINKSKTLDSQASSMTVDTTIESAHEVPDKNGGTGTINRLSDMETKINFSETQGHVEVISQVTRRNMANETKTDIRQDDSTEARNAHNPLASRRYD